MVIGDLAAVGLGTLAFVALAAAVALLGGVLRRTGARRSCLTRCTTDRGANR